MPAAALVHAAIFDSVNAVDAGDGRYTPYKVKVMVPAGASAEAAAAAAAHAARVRVYAAQRDALAEAYANSLGRIADGAAKTDGIAVGERVGAKIVAFRASDGATPGQRRGNRAQCLSPCDGTGCVHRDPVAGFDTLGQCHAVGPRARLAI